MGPPLVWGSAADIAAAVLFAFVGARVSRRHVSRASRLANAALACWWFGIAVLWSIDGARGWAAVAGLTTRGDVVEAFAALYYAWLLILCVSLWGLLTYLVFLFGGRRAEVPLALFYGAYFVVAAVAVAYVRPDGIDVNTWSTQIHSVRSIPAWVQVSLFAFLLLPQVGGAIAYLTLLLRASGPAQRYRISLVGTALLVWITANLVADVVGLQGQDAWDIVRRVLAIVAAGVILAGYHPPAWVARRLVRGVPA